MCINAHCVSQVVVHESLPVHRGQRCATVFRIKKWKDFGLWGFLESDGLELQICTGGPEILHEARSDIDFIGGQWGKRMRTEQLLRYHSWRQRADLQ